MSLVPTLDLFLTFIYCTFTLINSFYYLSLFFNLTKQMDFHSSMSFFHKYYKYSRGKRKHIYKYKYLNLPYGNMRLGNSTKHMDVSFVWRMKTCWSQSILNSLIAILLWPKAHQARSYFLMLYKSFSSLAHINGLKVKNQNSNVKKLGLSIRKEICVA